MADRLDAAYLSAKYLIRKGENVKPTSLRRIAALFGLPLCLVLPGKAQAFYIDGFWSSMTVQQMAYAASAQGLMARPGEAGYWYLSTGNPPHQVSKVGFCRDRLVSYTREIQSDTDYANVLAGLFRVYGPPSNMHFSGDVEPGSTYGAFRAIGNTLWEKGADRVSMTSYFDWRLYQGELYRQQPANIRYETLNPCDI